MARIGVAFLVGMCLIHGADALPDARWAVGLAAALIAALFFRAFLIVAVLGGVAYAWAAAASRLADDLAPALEGEDLAVSGFIASLVEVEHGNAQFLFDVVTRPEGAPKRIQLAWYRAAAVPQTGELWRFTVRLKRRNGFANPGGFDYERRLFQDGVGATGYVREDAERLAPPRTRYAIDRVRAWLAQRLTAAIGDDPMLGVVQGLAIGDARAITAEQWRVFAQTGTTHLMAISGLHISMAAALLAWAGGALVRRLPGAQRRGWRAAQGQVIGGGSAALAYSALAGMSIPTQRTLMMLCVYFVALWLRRELAPTHALGLALVAVLLIDPFAPLAAGAWLSFGAVAVILLALNGRLRQAGPVLTFGRVQFALTIGLAPFLLGAFGAVSLVAPLANLFAVPLFTMLVVPSVLLGAFFAAVNTTLGALILGVPTQLLQWSWPALQWCAEQPLALWRFAQPSPAVFVAMCIGAVLFAAPGLWLSRILGALLCLPAVFNRPATPAHGAFELVVLDVGQGLANVVFTQSHVLVYDAGPAFQSGRDTGELVLAPYLQHRGVRRIDALVISHGDLDHQGGANSVLATLPAARVIRGPSVSMAGDSCVRGQRWTWDGVEFEVLHPDAFTALEDNDSSCVVSIRSAAGAALLTGDVEAAAEGVLLERSLASVDVVVAPHHGSRTSSTAPFVDVLHPKIAVFSTGYRNRWGFPREEIVARWRAVGARTFDTAHSGALEISFTPNAAPRVTEHRRAQPRYWRR